MGKGILRFVMVIREDFGSVHAGTNTHQKAHRHFMICNELNFGLNHKWEGITPNDERILMCGSVKFAGTASQNGLSHRRLQFHQTTYHPEPMLKIIKQCIFTN